MKKKLILFALFSACMVSVISSNAEDEDEKVAGKLYVKGSKKFVNGHFKAAEKQYTDALELNPSYELYFKRGCARYEAHSIEEALTDFEKAVKLSPSFAEAYNHRGIVRLELGDTSGAMSDHCKAIELNPFYADGYYQRAYVKMQMGFYKEAIKDYDKAIDLAAETAHPYMYLNRGYALYFDGKYFDALQNVKSAIAATPDNPYFFKIKALIEIEMGERRDACNSISEALGLGYTEAYGNDLEKLGKKNCR